MTIKKVQKRNFSGIIPQPVELILKDNYFNLTKDTKVNAITNDSKDMATYLQKQIILATNLQLPIINDKKLLEYAINIEINELMKDVGLEGYILKIANKNVILQAFKPQGIFYGIQTFKQLIPIAVEKGGVIENQQWDIPCLSIKDYPRFKWRGFMLDEARHFMGKEIVKKILELMALHKMNKFHWHLIDDQGWRIEIKKYPKLIGIGSKRKVKTQRGEKPLPNDPQMYGGYYTQEDIREIVEFANAHYIEIIPEIEMPGHCSSALAAYPELSCGQQAIEVPTKWMIFKNVYCLGRKNVYTFLEDILTEIIQLFPGDIIHIGGDEVYKGNWKMCVDCQNKMKRENIKKVKDLQIYLTNYIAKFLKLKNKKLMGWNQILNSKISEETICQYWLGSKKDLLIHIEKGQKVVMSNMFHVYLDLPYFFIPLKKAYEFDPILKEIPEKFRDNILGIETPLWTERVVNERKLYYQMFPRLTAYAETDWSKRENKNFKSFMNRLIFFIKRLETLGVYNAFKNR